MKENYEHESRERERERERVKAPSKNTFIKLQKIFALFLVTFFLFSATPALAFNPFTAIYDYFFPRTENAESISGIRLANSKTGTKTSL